MVAFFGGCIFLTLDVSYTSIRPEIQGFTPLRASYLLMPGGLSLLLFSFGGAYCGFGSGPYRDQRRIAVLYGCFHTSQRRRREYAVLDFVFWTFYPLRVGLHDAGGECDGLESSAGRNGQSSERYD